MKKTEKKTVVISGAASGIGLAMMTTFLDAGYQVAALDISAKGLADAKELLGDRGDVVFIEVDMKSDDDIRSAIAATIKAFGKIDVVCSNAGVLDDFLFTHEVTDAMWDHVLGVNLSGAMMFSRAVIPHMLNAGQGIIINTSSIAGVRGGRAGVAYTVSKHGVIGLTRNVAATYGDQGIRCNAILPGTIETSITTGVNFSEASLGMRAKVTPSRPEQGQPEQIASVALFLASDGASYVNGETIAVDGGWINH